MTPLKDRAIQTALTGDWNTAISLNLELLEQDPDNIETLNRLAFAFTAMGKIKQAKEAYLKVLKLDNQNPIALKNFKRLSNATKKQLAEGNGFAFFPGQVDNMFIEESGKTKVIDLINVAEPKVVQGLNTGELVHLRIKRLKIFILDPKDHYIGMLPDNIGKRLIKFIKGGNQYEALIKAVQNIRVTVFIKEIKRSVRFKNQPSFITSDASQLVVEKNGGARSQTKQKISADLDEEAKNYSSDSEDEDDSF